jgi:hypothetical protein
MSMKLLVLGEGKFLDIFLSDIEKGNMIMHYDEMVKERKGLGLRERRKGYSPKLLDYFDSLD